MGQPIRVALLAIANHYHVARHVAAGADNLTPIAREIEAPDLFGLEVCQLVGRATVKRQSPKVSHALSRVHVNKRFAVRRPLRARVWRLRAIESLERSASLR